MSRAARLGIVGGSVVVVVAIVIAYLGLFALPRPGNLGTGTTTNIHVETVAQVNQAVEWARPNDPHPDWVAYLPTTVWHVPANSVITMQIDQEDGASGLRNPFWSQVQGIEGGKMHIKYTDDKGNQQEGDFSSINPDDASHTFAIPQLGVFVPLLGVPDNAAPGTINTITFSFRTKGPGTYRWQCFVPCAAGTLFNNGGPMQTLGYMGGYLVVQ